MMLAWALCNSVDLRLRLAGLLQVPRLRAAAAQGVAKALSSSYHTVYKALADGRSGAEGADASEVSEALRQTPEHVDTILGIS